MRETIGRYRVTGLLGEGGMGVVHAAVDERLGRAVAIKTLHAAAADPVARERLQREARAAARVNHPNICQLYELGDEEGELFLAMELLQGEPLATRLTRGALPAIEAIGVALGILAGLDALHREGIVHRDLKPSNIFLTPHGVKLLDFGVASTAASVDATLARLTSPGTIIGTPLYAAPEQLREHAVDARTDVYAAGVVLYEMLAGAPPFSGRTLGSTVHAIVNDSPAPLAGIASAAIDRTVRTALAKRPDDRYPSADAMARDLRMALAVTDDPASGSGRSLTRLIVLPLRVLRPDPDTDFLAFSLADAITSGLSGLQSLVVRSSAAALRFANVHADLKSVAADAEVDAVLTGTLLRGGPELRVATQLVEVPSGTVLWSHTAQVSVGDVFSVQDELTSRILDSLAIPLTAREERMLKKDVPATPRAYDLYLRANELSRDTRQWRVALDVYKQCVSDDPRYAPGWAGLGRIHRLLGKYVEDATATHFSQAEDALKRALDLNPDLSMAENTYAALEVDLGRSETAMVRLVRRARERPSDPELFAGLLHAARYCGLLRASVAAAERARLLDPSIRTSLVQTYFMRGEYARMLELDIEPYMRGLALSALGSVDEAIATLESVDRSVSSRLVTYALALLHYLRGDRQASTALIRQLRTMHDPEGRFYVARQMAQLGETEDALDVLGGAVRDGFFCIPAIAGDPAFDSIRGLPQFANILREAEARHRRAIISFISAEGDRVLGIEYPV
jgi:serine/threonine protein kinase/tetratricopeptide (TPR) repeat protein